MQAIAFGASNKFKGICNFYVLLKEVVFGYTNVEVGISLNLTDILDYLTMNLLNV